jgi:pyruvate dehydrogenase E1 component beta subunit
MVLRTQGGVSGRGAAQHSQSLEAWLTHIPGQKVVMPSNAADAAGLLRSAIADESPVVFVENKALYFQKQEVPVPAPMIEIGSASVVRAGDDITLIATSRLVGESLKAAETLAQQDGVQAEVIDVRTLQPLDTATLQCSVSRTGRAVIAHEAVTFGGFGAELAAQVQALAFDFLRAPIQRVGAPFTPVPLSPPLEDAYRVGADAVVAAAREAIAWDQPASAGAPD